MEEKRQIFLTEELGVICVDPLPSRRWNSISPSPHTLWAGWLLHCKVTECEKGRTVTLQWRSLADSTSTRRSVTTTSDVTWTLWLPDRMRRERQLISVIFFPQTCNPRLIVRRTSDKPKLRDILQNTWRVLFKSWKEKWENSHRETSRHNN